METDHEAREYSQQQQQLPDASPPAAAASSNNSFIGRHRMGASISILQNQIKLLQEELDQLESLGESSIVCKELAFTVESTPDPLLPLTQGPVGIDWDRWFQPVHSPRRRWL